MKVNPRFVLCEVHLRPLESPQQTMIKTLKHNLGYAMLSLCTVAMTMDFLLTYPVSLLVESEAWHTDRHKTIGIRMS